MLIFIISVLALITLLPIAKFMYEEANKVKREYEVPRSTGLKLKSTVVSREFEKEFKVWDKNLASKNLEYVN